MAILVVFGQFYYYYFWKAMKWSQLTTPISFFVFSTSSCSWLTIAIVPSTFPLVSVDSNRVVCVKPEWVVSIRVDRSVLVLAMLAFIVWKQKYTNKVVNHEHFKSETFLPIWTEFGFEKWGRQILCVGYTSILHAVD